MKSLFIRFLLCSLIITSSVYAADLELKVRDRNTNETVYEAEKNYSPEEQEAIRQREIMRRQSEQQAKQSGGYPALPAGVSQEARFEYKKLVEGYNRCSTSEKKTYGTGEKYNSYFTMGETPDECRKRTAEIIKKMVSDPEYYVYKKMTSPPPWFGR